ncbi:MAG TPA: hypothetical protein VH619_18730 [Verrucomicrobiae bacterium]|jgi:hypothetical protein|nr:hypothetical protein [Verrucomicrobiae bacterium]
MWRSGIRLRSEMSVQEIKEAVQHLSLEERAEIAACLHSWDNDVWDEQMKRDAASGKFAKLIAEVDADIAKNNFHDMS